jgi:hypothetical protein
MVRRRFIVIYFQLSAISSKLDELRVISSRSLRSAQARKRVPSLPLASLGHLFALAALRSVPQAGSQFGYAVIYCNLNSAIPKFLNLQSQI